MGTKIEKTTDAMSPLWEGLNSSEDLTLCPVPPAEED